MSLLSTSPGERLGTDLKPLPDGRYRLTVREEMPAGFRVNNDAITPYGTIIDKPTTGKYSLAAAAYLIDQDYVTQGGMIIRIRIYETLHATAEVQVGKNKVTLKDDGTTEIEADFLQLAGATATPGTVGTTTPPSPHAAVGVLAEEIAANDGAVRRIGRRYVSAGIIATATRDVEDGFAEVTYTSVRTEQTPPGVVTARSVQKPNGVPVYTVTARGTKAGGAVNSLTYSFTTKRQFRLPGRLKPFLRTVEASSPGAIPSEFEIKCANLYQSSPVDVWVDATTTVSYTSATTPGTITPALWNPTEWATVDTQVILVGPNALNKVEDYPGYCVVSDEDTPGVAVLSVLTPAGPDAIDWTYAGNRLFAGDNTHTITVRGPESPAGSSVTIDVDFRPAFVAADGTRWYRKTLVTATLPGQTALPV